MERISGFAGSQAQSFSLPSLVEGSEPISEAEELLEMKSLLEKGHKALKVKNFHEAIQFYNEALEIDERNVDVLLAHATACIEMGDFITAQRDTEFLISYDSSYPQAYKILGIALQHLHQYKEALTAFLTAINLGPDNADELTDLIAHAAAQICNISEQKRNSLKDMDSYKRLSEVGVCLFQAKKYKICIKLLEVAQKFQTNQKGITMKVLLTSANAHSALKHTEKAIGLYQECLQTAVATHDYIYQTKALVNIATLYLENRDTHQAIVFYEKLLHLEADLVQEAGSEDILPDFWSKELQCGLHLNLSIAYKAIGDMHSAIQHAKMYVQYVEKFGFKGKMKAESYHNTGMLSEILGNYNDAINNYNKYLQECKLCGDRKGTAQAFGCLGSVYAALRNWHLSVAYHEQYVAMASKFEDQRMQIIANEMLADTLMLKGDYEAAVKAYEDMINSCIRTDYRTRATAMCKLGNAYRALKKSQHSLHFYEQAAELAEDFEFPEIKTLSHYNIACIHQQSSQMLELEKSLKYFQQLVPYYESKIREHMVENSHCPEEYYMQLRECYDGIQTVHAKLGNKEECLQFAEAYRKRSLTQTHNYQSSALTSLSHTAPWDIWSIERMGRVVSQQNCTVLYYSLLTEYLLLWVLQPGPGLVRFYSRRAKGNEENMIETVEGLIEELRKDCDWDALTNECEARTVPLKNSDLEMTRKKNLNNRSQSVNKKHGTENGDQEEEIRDQKTEKKRIEAENKKNEGEMKSEKSAERRLYDLLFSPIEDILTKLPKDSPLIIIPDKALHHCPFNVLQDFLNRYAFKRFHITLLPHLLLLDKVVANELNHLRAQDDLEFERHVQKKGGVMNLINKYGGQGSVSVCSSEPSAVVNPKRVANPRLLTRPLKVAMVPPKPGILPKQATMFEEDFRKHLLKTGLSPRTHNKGQQVLHNSWTITGNKNTHPTSMPLERMFNVGTFTTLVANTSTGTDITTSSIVVTEFKQVSCQERCLVFGNPKLPQRVQLHGKLWQPNFDGLQGAQRELTIVATLLDANLITGHEATKDRFLSEIEKATVVHIVTYGCWHEGLIVCAPSIVDSIEEVPSEESYLVTADNILSLKLTAQLVVLNMAFNPYRKAVLPDGYLLPSAFIAAGAQCVLTNMWPLPDIAVEKFYCAFYMALQKRSEVTVALTAGIQALRDDDRFNSPLYWSAFLLVGKDTYINISDIRHSMLDQLLDQCEADAEEETGKAFLNPKPVLTAVRTKSENLQLLQKYLRTLLCNHYKQPNVLVDLVDLLESSLKRLHTEEINKQTTLLSDVVLDSISAIDLLKFLGFHFQAKRKSLRNPYVIYPHWNKDELLVPTFDALRALYELTDNMKLVQTICSALPLTQDNISMLIDLLSITKHAPEIQLKVSDLSVRPLWIDMNLKKLLLAAGFHQIGILLNFNRSPENRHFMMLLFQLLMSVSLSKSQVLLHRLDIDLLGATSESKSETDCPELLKLPTLSPLILPRNQLRMSTPWLSKTETPQEMEEKIHLARNVTNLDETFHEHLERAKTWHYVTVVAQANECMKDNSRPKTTPVKVKVLPGASASTSRTPLDQHIIVQNQDIDQHRDYANYVYQERILNIDSRHKNEVLKLYLPYINSV